MRAKGNYTLERELQQYFIREKLRQIIPWGILIFFSLWSLLLQLEKVELKTAWEIHQHNQEAVLFQQEKQMSQELLEKDELPVDKTLKILKATSELDYQSMEIKAEAIRTVFQGAATEDVKRWISAVEDLGARSSLRKGEGDKQWNQLEIEVRIP